MGDLSGRPARDKGARFERELARRLGEHGFEASRNARNGISTDDLSHTVPGVHFEAKFQETWTVGKWMRQAESDAGDRVPVVVFRRSRGRTYVMLPFEDFLNFLSPQLLPFEKTGG